VQFYGECWSGDSAHVTYDRYGGSSRCTATVGTQFTNMVYRFVGDGQSVELLALVVCLPSIPITSILTNNQALYVSFFFSIQKQSV